MLRHDPAATVLQAGADGGQYVVGSCEPGWLLFFILSWGGGWEHVSCRAVRTEHGRLKARRQERTPTWREMCQLRDLCWDPSAWVVQFHPPTIDYVNVHPHVLHLWRPVDGWGLTPPRELV